MNCSDLQGIFRIIQSVPSKKAEPVKQWLAELGQMRIDQMIDPELTFQMAVRTIGGVEGTCFGLYPAGAAEERAKRYLIFDF